MHSVLLTQASLIIMKTKKPTELKQTAIFVCFEIILVHFSVKAGEEVLNTVFFFDQFLYVYRL